LRNSGADTPWKGITDFMYVCISGAAAGSPTCRKALRKRDNNLGDL
jgi:hypothetical protein